MDLPSVFSEDPSLASPSSASFTHGGPDALGVARHDFSTNGNAAGPCPEALRAVRMADATCYPDPGYTALREKLADRHAVSADRIVVAASASEFIFRITGAARRQGLSNVALPMHAYGDYARAALAWGMRIAAEADVETAPDTGTETATAKLVWCCDPSSPLGRPVAGLGAFIDQLAPTASCVLDLAYEPLRLEGSLALESARLDRVWQLWTPNKALGLTGVRAAYAIAPSQESNLRASVQDLAPSWPVGTHGVALLKCWTEPSVRHWLADSLDTLKRWKARQLALCGDLGWRVRPGVANFFCVDPGIGCTGTLVAALRERSVKVRDAASFGLHGQFRIAVQSPEAQDALREAVIAARTFPGPAAVPASRCPPLS